MTSTNGQQQQSERTTEILLVSCSQTTSSHHEGEQGEQNGIVTNGTAVTRSVTVTYNNGQNTKTAHFPPYYLRDNCPCPKCFHPTSKQRLLDSVTDVPLDTTLAKSVSLVDGGRALRVEWEDGHESEYGATWLRQRDELRDSDVGGTTDKKMSSLEERHAIASTVPYLPQKLWKRDDVLDRISYTDFPRVMTDDSTLDEWITSLWVHGVAIMRNLPTSRGQLSKLAGRVSPLGQLRSTNYGTVFHVEHKMDPNNLAYTSSELTLHSDLPFFKHKPDIQMLHCIQQADVGGDSVLADGFRVARDFEKEFPRHYNVLTRALFTFNDEGIDSSFGPYDLRYERPIIEVDGMGMGIAGGQEGLLRGINVNNHVRSSLSFRNKFASREEEDFVMEAYYKFVDMLRLPEYVLEYRLAPGEMVAFDNNRVLHGRRGFHVDPASLTKAATRELEGGYLDWDLVYSRFRTRK